ncbi:MAG: hypothetical protein CML61_10075 [Rhodobacteraceae bacterium]|nr:hypothetical protein [Paracoccaceae bacterium]|tara:strand:+ start:243 stop:638 length:396 start_codon:yes stop_codon:yes gene_type:complete
MNKSTINNALKERLASGGIGISGVWPNVGATVARPFFEVEITTVDRTSPLRGNKLKELGIFSVVVVVEGDTGEDAANGYATAVANLFAPGVSVTSAGVKVSVVSPPTIQGGFKDGPDWRVPVIIRYRATKE